MMVINLSQAHQKGAKYIVTAKQTNENKNKTIRTNNENYF